MLSIGNGTLNALRAAVTCSADRSSTGDHHVWPRVVETVGHGSHGVFRSRDGARSTRNHRESMCGSLRWQSRPAGCPVEMSSDAESSQNQIVVHTPELVGCCDDRSLVDQFTRRRDAKYIRPCTTEEHHLCLAVTGPLDMHTHGIGVDDYGAVRSQALRPGPAPSRQVVALAEP